MLVRGGKHGDLLWEDTTILSLYCEAAPGSRNFFHEIKHFTFSVTAQPGILGVSKGWYILVGLWGLSLATGMSHSRKCNSIERRLLWKQSLL